MRYVTLEFPQFDIHLRTLKDKLQFSDDNKVSENLGINSTLWPIFGVVWKSGKIMANLMCTHDVQNKKILEIGCGIGLSSLVLSKMNADITVTDYHPESENFLIENAKLNELVEIDFHLCNWKDKETSLGKFDLIIGSDLLYQDDHSLMLSSFIDMHANDGCEVIIVSPKRGYQEEFNSHMSELGYSHEKESAEVDQSAPKPFDGFVHKYVKGL